MAVAFDAKGNLDTAASTTAVSLSGTPITIGSGANRALAVFLAFGQSSSLPTGITVTCGGVSMSAIPSASVLGTSLITGIWFGLVNPASGTPTITASWTGGRSCIMQAISATGVNQGGASSFAHGNSISNAILASTASLSITSAVGNLTVAAMIDDGGTAIASMNAVQDSIVAPTSSTIISGTNHIAGSASNTHTATYTGTDAAIGAGFDFVAAGVFQTGSTLVIPGSTYAVGLANANSGTVSTTITVPSDAELVVVGFSGFTGTPAHFYDQGSMTFTKGGVDTAMTAVPGDSTPVGWGGGMFYLALPDTGSNKTLKWDWVGAGTASDVSSLVSITFWKGIDTASPVRDTGFGGSGTNTPYTTGTITAVTGDLIVAWVGAFVNNVEGSVDSWSNLTLLSQITHDGSADGAWATGSPSGNTTVAASSDTSMDDGSIWAISLKPVGAAASQVIVPVAPLSLPFLQKFPVFKGPFKLLPNTVGKSIASGVVDTPISPPQGNLALSPTAETVLVSNNINIVPPQGNLALSPTAETVSINFNIVPLQGNLALSPTAETVVVSNNINIVPPQGNLVLSPTAETVVQNINRVPLQGNLALSPTAETVAWTDNRNIVPPQGNVALSPTAPTSAIGFNIVSPQGNLVLSPTAETVAISNNVSIVPPQGNLALSPTAETVVQNINRVPLQGNAALSPTAPAVSISIAAFPLQGNLALSPTAPAVVWTDNHPISVPQGNLALSPTAETLGFGLKPAQGNAALSPTAPTVAWTDNRQITVPQGNLALSPTAPSAGGAMSRVPLQGNLALSPTAPTVVTTANRNIVPLQGNVVLSPTAPDSVVNFRITVAQGNIVLSGSPPQTTPGLHPVSGNLALSSVAPVVVQDRLHHWRRITSLLGNIDHVKTGKGSVDIKPSLKGSVKQNKDIGAG